MAAKAKQSAVAGGVPGMALSIFLSILICSCEKLWPGAGEAAAGPAAEAAMAEAIVFRSAEVQPIVSTRADVVTSASLETFNVSATSGQATGESELWTNVPFAREGDVFTGGKWWPASSAAQYHFYASNAALQFRDGRTTVSASADEDIVCAYLPSPVYKAVNALAFEHIFASIGTVTVLGLDGYDISAVTVALTPRIGGVYDLAAGAGKADSTGWSSTVEGPESVIASSIGDNENDLWLVPGAYTLTLGWTAIKGDYAETFAGRAVEVQVAAGEVSELRIGLRGSGATGIAFSVSVAPRGVRRIDIEDALAQSVASVDGVDLGLRDADGRRLLFAPVNVGAAAETDPGDFFAFGDTALQYEAISGGTVQGASDLSFSWSSAPYRASGSGVNSRWNRYTADKDDYAASGTADGLSVLLPEDDVARRQWGGAWRLPTRDEWQQLIDSCTWEWTDDHLGSGVPGYLVRGSGAAIFLPAGGYCEKSYPSPSLPVRLYESMQGCYWSATVYERIPSSAQSLHFSSGSHHLGYNGRCIGATVRPVCAAE